MALKDERRSGGRGLTRPQMRLPSESKITMFEMVGIWQNKRDV